MGWFACAFFFWGFVWVGPAAAQIVWPQPVLTQVIGGLSDPVHVANAGDGSGRLFLVERAGRIRIYKNGSLLGTPFLDIQSRVSTGGERGLLSVAFPMGYTGSGRFYVFYTDLGGDIVIARYQVTANPDVANAASETILLTIEHSAANNHNGGQLAFSPINGYLYISVGDGGNTPDEAKNLASLLGKILRIDVESGVVPYAIPPSNPYASSSTARKEIWVRGLRNPWRFAFDRFNGDLYVADVGQNVYEEVNVQRVSSPGGEHYGWNTMEGMHCYPSGTCNQTGLTLPVVEYTHASGRCAVMGGPVYRGSAYPRMQGINFYADYCSGDIWGLQYDGSAWQSMLLTRFNTSYALTSFGEGQDGSIYFTDSPGGAIYRITDTVAPSTADMRVTLAASPSTATVGQAFTLTATVTNLGSATATGVSLTETLASGPTIGAITPSQGSCSRTNQTVTCTLGTMASGANVTVSVVLTPAAAGTLTNTASVSATQSDPDTANNSASLQTSVVAPSADVAVSVADAPDPVATGETLTYTLTVTNNGPSGATGVTVTDTLPSGVSFLSSSVSQGTCSGTSTITCALGSLGPGSAATVTIRVRIPSSTGSLSNPASVSASQPDPVGANNSATVSTSVVVTSPMTNISTRGRVQTGDDVMIGGFIVGGSAPKTLLIRARGGSLGGAPFNNQGVLANPTMQLFSGQTVIAQNNDWQTTDPLCASPATACGGAPEITATGLDPCQPNPGQSVAPPGCAQESALHVTLPPATYTVIVRGVGATSGMGLVEVFEADTGASKLTNISTRARVETGDNVMIGGFIVGGSAPKTVLIRARGGSLGGAPFSNQGVLANPTMQLYSGQTVIAQNNDWQTTDSLCLSPATACGGVPEITATGLDPCQPNPGQTGAPPGCAQESALYVTLPPATYTVIVRGVSATSGMGLVEVFEEP